MEKRCIFTGHRVIPKDSLVQVEKNLYDTVEELYQQGYTCFYAGGARGFDRMAGDAVLRLRKKHPQVQLHLILPCQGQEQGWPLSDRLAYRKQIKAADSYEYLFDTYFDGCMKERNSRLASLADICVAYVTHSRSGSAQTVRMVEERGIPVLNLAEYPNN